MSINGVGYASFTMYNGWAHLDRLAVIAAHQGRKFGAAQLTHAMAQMATHGAGHVGILGRALFSSGYADRGSSRDPVRR